MYLKELTLQGFKSYADRTIIGEFDRHFNALTGLNGSGKSNVLDGVCFALGLTNLSNVRANSLQDLVYQQGQSGVRSAVVSLTFDNSDKSKSPRAYVDCGEINVTREIMIQGRNKFRINGRNADHKTVGDLFQSVGMNINNPHFVIMQGKITQVLNMKPLRILAMLEEAAGTSIYDRRKANAMQKLVNNDSKLEALDKVTRDDLLPKMQIQGQERMHFREYNTLSLDLKKLRRFCTAYEFAKCQSVIDKCSEGNVEKRQEISQLDQQTRNMELELKSLVDKTASILQEKEAMGGKSLRKAEDALSKLEKRIVVERSKLANCTDQKEAHVAEKAQIQADLNEISEETYRQKCEEAMSKHETLQKSVMELEGAIRAAECNLASIEDGNPRDEEGRTLPERLDLARTQEITAKGDAEAIQIRVSTMEDEWNSLKQSLKSRAGEAKKQEKQILNSKQQVQKIESQLQALAMEPGEFQQLQEQVAAQRENVKRSKAAFRQECAASDLDISFQDPYPAFNRHASVKGVLAKLFSVKDSDHALALEVAMGGHLRNLVVDTAQNAKHILKNGRLKRRTTIIPLDQIEANGIDRHAREAVQRAVGDDAIPAIDLVSFDPEFTKALEYACGRTFICKDADIGSRLSRDLKGLRFVTVAGQDFSTDGTFSDGYRDPKASILKKVGHLQNLEADLSQQEKELADMEQHLQALEPKAKEHQRLSKELGTQSQDLSLQEEHLSQSSYQQDMQTSAQMESEISSVRSKLLDANKRVEELVRVQEDLQRQISMLGTDRQDFIKETQSRLKSNKGKLKKIQPKAREAELAYMEITAEGSGAVKDREKLTQKLLGVDKELNETMQHIDALNSSMQQLEVEFKAQESALQEQQKALTAYGEEMQKLEERKKSLESLISDVRIGREAAERSLHDLAKEEKMCLHRKDELLKDFSWIAAERSKFGVAGTEYDWNNNDPKRKLKEHDDVVKRLEALKPKMNKNAEFEYNTTKEEMYKLEKRRIQLQGDKKKIKKMMHNLDIQKTKRIEGTWSKVKDKMGEIFRTLLPGADATLQPLSQQSILDGVEIKVALGGKWKDSLMDLSGGQRSLCALALVLALLAFRPVPIYILDEIDAALDLSHTQNMGMMIRKFFPQSQFLIVSLKEGMFSNANVLFRTKLVQGKSSVFRSIGKKG